MAARASMVRPLPPPDRATPEDCVRFGPGAIGGLSALVAEHATARGPVLVVTGRSALSAAWRPRVLRDLRPLRPAIYVHPEPLATPETVGAIRDAARAHGARALVAIGGGTVMDAAKAAGAGGPGGSAVPVVAVPTTPGTGAEVTPFATVWDLRVGRKTSVQGVAPTAALIDPVLALTLGDGVMALSLLDALTQGAEAAWSVRSTPASTAAALTAVSLAASALNAIGDRCEPLPVRVTGCLAGTLSGRAIAIAQTTACHAVSYPLTLRHGCRHADASSLTLAPMLRFNAATTAASCTDPRGAVHVRAAVAAVVQALAASGVSGAARRIAGFRALAGLPAAAPAGGVEIDADAIAREALSYGRAANGPRRLEAGALATMLRPSGRARGEAPC